MRSLNLKIVASLFAAGMLCYHASNYRHAEIPEVGITVDASGCDVIPAKMTNGKWLADDANKTPSTRTINIRTGVVGRTKQDFRLQLPTEYGCPELKIYALTSHLDRPLRLDGPMNRKYRYLNRDDGGTEVEINLIDAVACQNGYTWGWGVADEKPPKSPVFGRDRVLLNEIVIWAEINPVVVDENRKGITRVQEHSRPVIIRLENIKRELQALLK